MGKLILGDLVSLQLGISFTAKTPKREGWLRGLGYITVRSLILLINMYQY